MASQNELGLCLRKIQLSRIAHVYYTHSDINKARQFLKDFGFEEVKRSGPRSILPWNRIGAIYLLRY